MSEHIDFEGHSTYCNYSIYLFWIYYNFFFNIIGEAVPVNHFDPTWRHYMSIEDFQNASFQLKLPIAKKFLENHVKLGDENATAFELNYENLISDHELLKQWPDIKQEIYESAEKVMGIFGFASIAITDQSKKTRNIFFF